MKTSMLILAVGLLARPVAAQETVPDDQAKKIAELLVQAAAKAKTPVKVEVDADQPFAKKKDERGAMVIPVKGLTAETVAKAEKDFVPLGQLWMRGVAPVADNKVVDKNKINYVTIEHDGQEVVVTLYFIGVQKVKDELSVVVLGKDKTPLVTVPLAKADEKLEKPLEFLVDVNGDERATVILQLLGKHKAKLTLGLVNE